LGARDLPSVMAELRSGLMGMVFLSIGCGGYAGPVILSNPFSRPD
jgi:hypothetical protein